VRILVSLGTDHHPFDRLVGWAERWAAAHPDDTVVVQHGTTTAPTGGLEHTELFTRDEMRAQIERADAVVISCGPGGVMDVRATGRLPIVVARRADLGEHVDDHQRAFAQHLARTGLAVSVETEGDFTDALEQARTAPEQWRVQPSGEPPAGIARIGELIDGLVWGS
jgi:UDP-N-acetylglucosamine transferase subunit ALG13